jgi:cardiolipin synthase
MLFGGILGFVAALVWGWGLYLAVKAVHDGRTSQGTLAWVIVLLVAPPIAIPAYFMLGDRRLEGYIRARRGGRRALDELFRQTLATVKPMVVTPEDPGLRVLATLAGMPWTRGNSIRAFDTGDAMLAALVAAIDRATTSIVVQFFIYREDKSGERLHDALARAVKRGVRVYLMYDELGCVMVPGRYFDKLRESGIDVSGFRTVPKRRHMLRLNFRNHRKLVVIDGWTMFFGGMNVGDEYRGRDPEIGFWRDTHACATGPAALWGQIVFAEDWQWAKKEIPAGLEWRLLDQSNGQPDAGPIGEGREEPAQVQVQGKGQAQDQNQDRSQDQISTPAGLGVERLRVDDAPVLMFPSGPSDEREAGVLFFLQLISQAKERLWITTPYFVCDESIMEALVLARLRGVDVRMLVPEEADKLLVRFAAKSYIRDSVAAGIPVYIYQRGVMHQKTVLCDQVYAVGSANLDQRSMRLNFELSGVVDHPDFARVGAAMFTRDVRNSIRVPESWWVSLTSFQRFQIRLARLFAPVL